MMKQVTETRNSSGSTTHIFKVNKINHPKVFGLGTLHITEMFLYRYTFVKGTAVWFTCTATFWCAS